MSNPAPPPDQRTPPAPPRRGGIGLALMGALSPGAAPDPAATAPPAEPQAAPPGTPAQRLALAIGLLVLTWLTLRLFAGVLAPFVTAAVIAYVLDPPTTRLARLGLPRGVASRADGRGAARRRAAVRCCCSTR